MTIAVVLVTHNRPDCLRQVFEALESGQLPFCERIVVDNASSIETAAVISQFSPEVVLKLTRNVGGAGGFTAGLASALHRGNAWIFLIDDDAIVCPETLHRLARIAESCPSDVGAICTSVIEDGAIAIKHRRYFLERKCQEVDVPTHKYNEHSVMIDEGSFVGFLLRADAARDVGLPVSEFFIAYDDTEYSLRLRRRGWKIMLAPDCAVEHLRNTGNRLRNSAYGMKHYYSLRNQIATLSEYAQGGKWRLVSPIAKHFALALATGGINGLKLFLKALRDVPEIRRHIKTAQRGTASPVAWPEKPATS